jgi:hypothetical protein
MTDDRSAAGDDGETGRVIGLLQVIAGLLVVIAIILLLIFVRGPEDQEHSAAPAVVAAIMASA